MPRTVKVYSVGLISFSSFRLFFFLFKSVVERDREINLTKYSPSEIKGGKAYFQVYESLKSLNLYFNYGDNGG